MQLNSLLHCKLQSHLASTFAQSFYNRFGHLRQVSSLAITKRLHKSYCNIALSVWLSSLNGIFLCGKSLKCGILNLRFHI